MGFGCGAGSRKSSGHGSTATACAECHGEVYSARRLRAPSSCRAMPGTGSDPCQSRSDPFSSRVALRRVGKSLMLPSTLAMPCAISSAGFERGIICGWPFFVRAGGSTHSLALESNSAQSALNTSSRLAPISYSSFGTGPYLPVKLPSPRATGSHKAPAPPG